MGQGKQKPNGLEKYRSVLPLKWQPIDSEVKHEMMGDLHEAMQLEERTRRALKEWLATPHHKFMVIKGEYCAMGENDQGRSASEEELKHITSLWEERIAKLEQDANRKRDMITALPIDSYQILGLTPEATPQQVYSAYYLYARVYRENIQHWERNIFQLGNVEEVDPWRVVHYRWNLETCQISLQRLTAAHDQLAATIGSEEPPEPTPERRSFLHMIFGG